VIGVGQAGGATISSSVASGGRSDVLADGIGEEEAILQHDAELAPQLVLLHGADIAVVHPMAPESMS
jgi:hypothetical protein